MMRWYAQDEVDQEESEHNEVDGMNKGTDSTGKVMHLNEQLVICNSTQLNSTLLIILQW